MKLFDEPEVLLLSPAGTIENANTAKRTSGFRATERTFQGKCWKCDRITHVRNAVKRGAKFVFSIGSHAVII